MPYLKWPRVNSFSGGGGLYSNNWPRETDEAVNLPIEVQIH